MFCALFFHFAICESIKQHASREVLSFFFFEKSSLKKNGEKSQNEREV